MSSSAPVVYFISHSHAVILIVNIYADPIVFGGYHRHALRLLLRDRADRLSGRRAASGRARRRRLLDRRRPCALHLFPRRLPSIKNTRGAATATPAPHVRLIAGVLPAAAARLNTTAHRRPASTSYVAAPPVSRAPAAGRCAYFSRPRRPRVGCKHLRPTGVNTRAGDVI